MAFAKKAHHVAAFKPDIAVIPECGECSVNALNDCGYIGMWVGSNRHKGLAVFVREPWIPRLISKPEEKWIAAVDVEQSASPLRVIAVWACKVGSRKCDNYIGQVYKAFMKNADWFTCPKTIVAGDFNSNSIWDQARPVGNHTAVVKVLREHGLVSAYHEYFQEEQGSESKNTHDFRKNRNNAFHIDYVFIPKAWRSKLCSVSIGEYDTWITESDHRPMIVDVAV
jgi:exonuclease III